MLHRKGGAGCKDAILGVLDGSTPGSDQGRPGPARRYTLHHRPLQMASGRTRPFTNKGLGTISVRSISRSGPDLLHRATKRAPSVPLPVLETPSSD